MPREVKGPVTLPPDWEDTERGNVWLVEPEGGKHLIYVKLDGDVRLEVSIVPANYPGLNMKLVEITDEELATHILKRCPDWTVRKLNVADPRLAGVGNGGPNDSIPYVEEYVDAAANEED